MIERDTSHMSRHITLSVCIPTYNRRNSVCALVATLLDLSDDLEVCVHVDGSKDGTADELRSTAQRFERLVITHDDNRGRAYALKRAIQSARGQYAMIYDDDDTISREGFTAVMSCLRQGASAGSCGFVFHMNDTAGQRIGHEFPRPVSNFLELRWDDQVAGDKKEVVETALLKAALYRDYPYVRRVPTSLLWSRLALKYNVDCVNVVVGRKDYLIQGLSNRITRLKLTNPQPMFDLYRTISRGYFLGRYRSRSAFLRALSRAVAYGVYSTLVSIGGTALPIFRIVQNRLA